MLLNFIKKHSISLFFGIILCIYLIYIIYINFSINPYFYSTDMYSDMCYAVAVWEEKSIFPDGWVFGNQFYVVATPVLAALFYGIFGNAALAMGISSTLMGLCVLFSFDWMLKAVLPSVKHRLLGTAVFMSLLFAFGGPVYETNGWQLLFTMCSFYACYAITAFLVFGCYIRGKNASVWAIILCCIMSFGTGMQSLRQTAIMLCPLIGTEFLCIVKRFFKKEKLLNLRTVIAGSVSLSNFIGLFLIWAMNVPQVEIFGNITAAPVSKLSTNAHFALINVFSLLFSTDKLTAALLAIICIFGLLYIVYRFYISKNHFGILCICLMALSIAGILILDIYTAMNIRNIYYFLLFPMIAVMVVCLYNAGGKWTQYLIIVLLVVTFINGTSEKFKPVLHQTEQGETYEELISYLEEKGITTVFSGWNGAEDIAIASNGKIKAGFWNSPKKPFVCVKYLCNPEVFDVTPEKCAYIFFSKSNAQYAVEATEKANVDFTLIKHLPDKNIYIYTSGINLMELFTDK